jgi:hypothetical protein
MTSPPKPSEGDTLIITHIFNLIITFIMISDPSQM